MDAHVPRLYKATGLLLLGCVLLSLPAGPMLQGYVLTADLVMAIGSFVLAMLEMILLFLEKYENLYIAVTEAIREAVRLTPETRELMGFGIEHWTETAKPTRVILGDIDNHKIVFDLPIAPAQIQPFAQALLNDIPFSEKQWVLVSKVMSAPKFRQLQNVMIKNGLAEYRNQEHHEQGVGLTRSGRAAMRYLVSQKQLPTY